MALVHTALSDFVLFPRDQSFFDMSNEHQDDTFAHLTYNNMDRDFYQDFADLDASSYSVHQPTTAFNSNQTPYQVIVEAPQDTSKYVPQRYTPDSPSTSMSHSLDHAPSVLSSTSCASVQSTASSAVGSPYSHPTRSLSGQDQWLDPQNGLCIAPNIIQNETFGHETFSLSGIDNDQVVFEHDKFSSNFVGELQEVSSAFTSTNHVMHTPVSSASNSHSLTSTTLPSASLALDTSVASHNITIDTILEEANSEVGKSTGPVSPTSAVSSVNPSPITSQSTNLAGSHRQNPKPFRSPRTPASARSPSGSRASSPFSIRRQAPRRGSSVDPGTPKTRNSPLVSSRWPHPYERPSPSQSPSDHSYETHFSTPFFSQSSGRFIAPLESSCSFSLDLRPFSIPLKKPTLVTLFLSRLLWLSRNDQKYLLTSFFW